MKLTPKILQTIVDKARLANEVKDDNAYVPAICLEHANNLVFILLNLYFGENNADLLWDFIFNKNHNKFDNIEQLYDYLSDKYSELVNKDSALTIDQLRQLFPEDKMFEFFEKVIKEHGSK